MAHIPFLSSYTTSEKPASHGPMPAGHPHEMLAHGKPPHDGLFTPGKGLMPHKLEGSDPRRFFAKENGDPLGSAFEGKIAVHPGMGGIPVPDKDREPLLDKAAATSCSGRKLAYIHVPFCETHCLYCSFFQNPYREEAGAAYVDTLIRDLALWCGKTGSGRGSCPRRLSRRRNSHRAGSPRP